MIYRQTAEKEKVEATITLTTEEFQDAIIQYCIHYKLIPEGIDIASIKVTPVDTSGYRLRPKISYSKETIKLFSSAPKS